MWKYLFSVYFLQNSENVCLFVVVFLTFGGPERQVIPQ